MKMPRLSKEAHKKEENIKQNLKNIINIGMIGSFKSIGISWGVLSPKFLT